MQARPETAIYLIAVLTATLPVQAGSISADGSWPVPEAGCVLADSSNPVTQSLVPVGHKSSPRGESPLRWPHMPAGAQPDASLENSLAPFPLADVIVSRGIWKPAAGPECPENSRSDSLEPQRDPRTEPVTDEERSFWRATGHDTNIESSPEPGREAAPAAITSVSTVEMPPELKWWIGQVQRKVSGLWTRPENIRLDGLETTAVVRFWVDRDGTIFEGPEVSKHASDPAVGLSGVAALQLAQPLPPLPREFPKSELRVEMTFTLSR